MAIEDVIAEQSVTIANQMLQIAEYAKTEREVELHSFTQIKAFCAKAGVKIAGEFDRTIGSGRPDAHYQGLIIEYKDPSNPATRIGPGSDSAGTKAVVKQIKERFPELERELHYPLKRLMGVGCDGRMLVFVRFRGGRWDVEPPQSVTPHSVERLLRALISLGAQGKSFTPEYLAADFGSDSSTAQKGVRDLYGVITATKSKKALTFFSQWKILFGEVCGYDVEGKNTKIQKLGDHYAIPNARPAELLFAVHSYYAIFMKFLAAEIAGSFAPLGASVLKKCVGAPSGAALKREMENVEQGGIWSQLNITNFLEGDLFSWYLDAWDDRVSGAVRGIVLQLDEYDPSTLSVDPAESRDLLKKLYQQLFPKSVRHDLGEYYTPDWLAEHVLNELGYDGNPDKRILDPGCGSGTFLVIAINRIKAWFDKHRHECGYGEAELVRKVLDNVIGFDLNPLAVMASRTNYLMALRDLLKHTGSVEIPVYLCDSIMTPAEYGDLFTGGLSTARKLRTSAAEFLIPSEIVTSREHIAKYADTLEFCVRNQYSAEDFLARCVEAGLPVEQDAVHRQLYGELRRLDADNQNGIWARIIKNAFAPLFVGQVDYVVGNPPWVNWESLPPDYRNAMKPLWQSYGLFTLSGHAARLGGGKKDLSMLFVYSTIDNYLRDGGRLGFVITQTVFKTMGAADGFRRFRLGEAGGSLKVLSAHDLVELQPFEGASNRTATMVLQKGEKTEYPVSYTLWRKTEPGRISVDLTLDEVEERTKRIALSARPVNPSELASPWLTTSPTALTALEKAVGPSDYEARAGSYTGGLNGVYWLRIIERRLDGLLVVENLYDVGKTKVKRLQARLEPDLVYPLLRGRDVGRWRAQPSAYILMVQDPVKRTGYDETWMRVNYPHTYAYLKEFEDVLRSERGSQAVRDLMDRGAFYSMYAVAEYTFAPYKVVWRYVATDFTCAVVGGHDEPLGGNIVIPDHRLMIVPLTSELEAHYLCSALSSTPARLFVKSYVVGTQISTHVLQHLAVPGFVPTSALHQSLASLSQRAHDLGAQGKEGEAELRQVEDEIDRLAAQLWGISGAELKTIQETLREMGSRQRRGTSLADDEGLE